MVTNKHGFLTLDVILKMYGVIISSDLSMNVTSLLLKVCSFILGLVVDGI